MGQLACRYAAVPGAAAARTTTPLEQSAAGLRAEGEALVAELRRWKEEWAEGVHAANSNSNHDNRQNDGDLFTSGGGFGSGFGGGRGGGLGGAGGGGARASGAGGGPLNLTRHDPSVAGVGLSAAKLAPMLSGAVFTVGLYNVESS
jgi:hypothetical protein